MIEKGEGKFTWIDRVLKVFLPLAFVLSVINFFFTKNQLSTEIILIYSLKILLILLAGFLEGKLEWRFFQRIFGPSTNSLTVIRKRFVVNIGVLTVGLPLGIINFRLLNDSLTIEYVRLTIWLMIGVFFGVLLWGKNKNIFKNIIEK